MGIFRGSSLSEATASYTSRYIVKLDNTITVFSLNWFNSEPGAVRPLGFRSASRRRLLKVFLLDIYITLQNYRASLRIITQNPACIYRSFPLHLQASVAKKGNIAQLRETQYWSVILWAQAYSESGAFANICWALSLHKCQWVWLLLGYCSGNEQKGSPDKDRIFIKFSFWRKVPWRGEREQQKTRVITTKAIFGRM